MAGQQSLLGIILEVKDKGAEILRSYTREVKQAEEGTKKFQSAAAKAAHDRAYPKSVQAVRDRLEALRRSQGLTMEQGAALARKNKDLARTQGEVTGGMVKTGVAGRALASVYRRLLAAALLFVSARAIKNFFIDSVKLFVENQKEADGLRGRIDALSESWKSFRIAVGAWIIEATTADDKGSALETTIESMRDSIVENWEQWVKWGRIAVESVALVGNGFKQFFDLVGNGWDQIILGAELAFVEIRLKWARTLNGIRDDMMNHPAFMGLMGIPGPVGSAFTGVFNRPPVPTGDLDKQADTLHLAIQALRETGGAAAQWEEFVKAVEAGRARVNAPIGLPPGRFTPPGATGGGGRPGAAPEESPFGPPFAPGTPPFVPGVGLPMPPGGLRGTTGVRSRLAPPRPTGMVGIGQQLFRDEIKKTLSKGEDPVEAISDFDQALLNTTRGSLTAFGDTFGQTVADVIGGSATMGDALGNAFRSGISTAASMLGDLYLGQAGAALAAGLGMAIPGVGHPTGFAAAAKYLAAGVAMKALAGVAGGGGGGGRGGGGGGRGGGFGTTGDTDFAGTAAGQTGTIIIRGGMLNMRDPRQANELAEAIKRLGRLRKVDILVEG